MIHWNTLKKIGSPDLCEEGGKARAAPTRAASTLTPASRNVFKLQARNAGASYEREEVGHCLCVFKISLILIEFASFNKTSIDLLD